MQFWYAVSSDGVRIRKISGEESTKDRIDEDEYSMRAVRESVRKGLTHGKE